MYYQYLHHMVRMVTNNFLNLPHGSKIILRCSSAANIFGTEAAGVESQNKLKH